MWRVDSLEKPWCWKGLDTGGEVDDRGWDVWMALPTWWTWVWVNFGSWWWTGSPGVLWFMGSQELGMIELLNWTELIILALKEKQVVEGRLVPFRNSFKTMKKQKKIIQKLWYISVNEGHSVMSDSLWHHGLNSPWNSPGQNPGLASCSLLQGIFPTQRSNPGLLHCRQIIYQLSYEVHQVCLSLLSPPFFHLLCLCHPETARPTSPLPPPWSIQGKNNENEDFYDDLLSFNK